MIRTISLYASTLSLLIVLHSCKKEDTNPDTGTIVSVTIKANQSYSYNLGSFGDEEGASINRHPMHYQVSSLERTLIWGQIYYRYQPALNYTGTDEVVIRSERGSNGASPNDSITITTIRFTISN